MNNTEIKKLRQGYQRLAYNVIRDAIGFFFGIPKFLAENKDRSIAYNYFLGLKLDDGEIPSTKLKKDIEEKIDCRIQDLEEDLEDCKTLLFDDNIWYQVLNLTPETFVRYLNSLSEEEMSELAIVPKWTTQDCSLGRPHITDSFSLTDDRTNSFN